MTVISFATGKPVSTADDPLPPEAVFEILSWDDPVMSNYAAEYGRVSIDGLVPPELAEKMKAMCDEWNASRERVYESKCGFPYRQEQPQAAQERREPALWAAYELGVGKELTGKNP